MPKRIQLRRAKGWRKPAGAVVVSRPSKWGNPYRVGRQCCVPGRGYVPVRDSAHAVDLYRIHVTDPIAGNLFRETVRRELRGKDLCCWCPLDQPCHADVLLELANE